MFDGEEILKFILHGEIISGVAYGLDDMLFGNGHRMLVCLLVLLDDMLANY